MPDPVATRHDSWIRIAVWIRPRVLQIRTWLAKEAVEYKSSNTTTAFAWMRDHSSEIHLQAVFVEQFSDHLVKVYHKLEA